MDFIRELRSFNNEKLIIFLKKNGFDEFCDIIISKEYDGNKFLNLSELEIQLWTPRKSMQQRKRFWNFLTDLKNCPEKYFQVESDEIYENRAEERYKNAEKFKRNFEELIKNDTVIENFKTALKQKEKEIISSDSFDSEEDELVVANNPKPNIMPKPNLLQQPSNPIKSPVKIIKSPIPLSFFDKVEKCLQKEVRRSESFGKNETTQLNASVQIRYKPVSPLPILPTKEVDDEEGEDEELPEYLDIDEEEEKEEDKQEVKKVENNMKIRDDIKRRPLPPLPPPSPDPSGTSEKNDTNNSTLNTKKIQKIPLPRPPKMLPDFASISIEDVEDFNFEQSFVSKYSKASFYRYTDRKGSERLLQQPNIKNGTFLVRPSDNHYCTISVKHNERVYQLAIHKGKGAQVIQADVEYESLEDYLEYYKKEALCLPSKTAGYVNVYLTDALPQHFL